MIFYTSDPWTVILDAKATEMCCFNNKVKSMCKYLLSYLIASAFSECLFKLKWMPSVENTCVDVYSCFVLGHCLCSPSLFNSCKYLESFYGYELK